MSGVIRSRLGAVEAGLHSGAVVSRLFAKQHNLTVRRLATPWAVDDDPHRLRYNDPTNIATEAACGNPHGMASKEQETG